MKIKSYQNNYSAFVKKDIALSSDFSDYFVRHEDIFEGLPQNPCIVVLDPKDTKSNKRRIAFGKKVSNGKKCYVAKKLGKKWEIHQLK